ncbi:MAG TPA: hypothetical protein VEB00_16360 [Clostridia bacterium]|nr:hypothetical protein [Clostridia bacterium]
MKNKGIYIITIVLAIVAGYLFMENSNLKTQINEQNLTISNYESSIKQIYDESFDLDIRMADFSSRVEDLYSFVEEFSDAETNWRDIVPNVEEITTEVNDYMYDTKTMSENIYSELEQLKNSSK